MIVVHEEPCQGTMCFCSHRKATADLRARIVELEDELAQANALTVYCDHCHSAPGEYCSDDKHKRCPPHVERVVAGSDAS